MFLKFVKWSESCEWMTCKLVFASRVNSLKWQLIDRMCKEYDMNFSSLVKWSESCEWTTCKLVFASRVNSLTGSY